MRIRAASPHPGDGNRVGWLVSGLVGAAFALRSMERFARTPVAPLATGLLALFIILVLGAPRLGLRGGVSSHVYLVTQSGLVMAVLALPPNPDVVAALFVPLALQASLLLSRRWVSIWVTILILLIVLPLMLTAGPMMGLALAVIPAAGCVILPAYAIAHQEIEAARAESQAVLDDLKAAHARLQAYFVQAEELASLEERGRLARDLHDSVSQIVFALSLHARAARTYLERDTSRLRPQLVLIQTLAEDALARIRTLLEHLRPVAPTA